MDEFYPEEVFSAYKKLKHYYYYDNTSLFLRQRIAQFEDEIDKSCDNMDFNDAFVKWTEKFATQLNTKKNWKAYFTKNIEYKLTPKSFKKKTYSYLTNRSEKEKLEIERINTFIDAPIEVHIIAVLWLMHAGRFLVNLVDQDNYAYQLELDGEEDEQKVVNGLRLYKPYFIQYQNWRDNALKKAEQLIEDKKDIVILSLDIKEYFHSVKINLDNVKIDLFKIKPELKDNEKVIKLFKLLDLINLTYTKKILPHSTIHTAKESCLPIGLLSSGLLGNLHLSKFDIAVKEELNPNYYGRYVDDLLFVLTNVKIEENAVYPINDFISKYFVRRKLLEFDNLSSLNESFYKTTQLNKKVKYSYRNPNVIPDDSVKFLESLSEAQKLKFCISLFPSLKIQSKKVVLQDLDHKESPAILNKFKKNLDKNRSEFRFLPEEDKVDKEFDEEAFNMHYSDSLNKLRSIKEFSEDKYGASKYLAGKIFAACLSDESADPKTNKQILTFFKGVNGISFHTLWEKVATYFIINNQSKSLLEFYNQSKKAIKNISFEHYEDIQNPNIEFIKSKIIDDINDYLQVAIATPLAFNPSMKFEFLNKIESASFGKIKETSIKIRHANFIRHSWVGLPSLNFTDYVFKLDEKKEYLNLLKIKEASLNICSLEIDPRLSLLSPRYVHFHELNVLEIYKTVQSIKELTSNNIQVFDFIPDIAFDKYWQINYLWKKSTNDETNKTILKADYFSVTPIPSADINKIINYNDKVVYVNIPSLNSKKENKKIAIANVKVEPNNIEASYLKRPNLKKDRRQLLFKLLNLVEEERCDLFVLPEVSVPYQWLGLLAYQSNRRSLGIIAGLEHWINAHGFAFNFMATILPIKRNNYSTCLIKIRLKNHYSPEEKRQLKGYRLLIPGETVLSAQKRYDLFHWGKTYFSVYNCFELADIHDRGLFKSRVDFIIASEYNKDTNYFAEIAGSWVRDIHCFFVQVNSSNYGDSRVIQPASSYKRDILQIKGGKNSTIVVGELPIRELRMFQLKEYELQKDDSTFKPTPPDYSAKSVEGRINDKDLNKL
ncbi:reverse transcriptase domain-containing protein [Mucilaginibacter lappiensis]|uniref:reverse transcriptase domain-containing protein n=1 Tax=Mucilaginibacter lappiensis TaxID=354630 RepID=UPI003D1C3AA9